MKIYKCDLSDSISIWMQYKDRINEGECYNNCFRLISEIPSTSAMKAVIGYVISSNNIEKAAVRHCWLVVKDKYTHEDKVIDPTIFADGYSPAQVIKYGYVEVARMKVEEWVEKIINNDRMPGVKGFRNEKKIIEMLQNEGYKVLD
jgi:hypothetical protein